VKAKKAKLASDGKERESAVGNHVRYLGLGGKRYCCVSCNRSFSRGFYYENNGKSGCTRRCLKIQLQEG